ncbi:MAG: phosphate ABC transporter permease subunit PstC [candidate division Zixibacteria bacterium]|nr:phosphate ABC transporter permease subunit PstC [candidate division Zixibacteria bacterium]NIR63093.1 phosphate ABC transporter permease subunit PstC [candidate division Zixibacteria bacterium]NIS16569.1 phosphate ABC transporter permease subunit PstC [candidate division Zixibacteria bacterium]NIS45090.1 phosphate ABC transporter permease subunit PstC [candidate division Zixibacteria bacterium]NIT52645.1 phosphate ABC transporter permease subunit PstC [candidate division Zixibacteria bacteri
MKNKAWKEKAAKLIFTGASSTAILIVLLIFLFLFKEAIPFIKDPGISKLFDTSWRPVSFQQESYGLAPLITGSFLVTILATIIAIPFGVIGAVYISEVSRKSEREFLKPFIELLAGIPSVVIGFFGLIVLAPFLKAVFGLQSGLTALTGALLLALMAIPTIISISEDAINSVPSTYKEASYAVGASKLQTIWKVTVPASISGITAAVMLGMGRVIGETMAVLMVTGNAAILTLSPFESVRTMTATIAAEMGEVPFGSDHYRALFWVGIVLLIITFGLNMIAQKVFSKYGGRQ